MPVCMTESSNSHCFRWSLKMFQTADQASSGLAGQDWRPWAPSKVRDVQATDEDRGLCAARRRVWWSPLIRWCRVVPF